MSLQHIAQHLSAQGRGPDTMLVHMAPSEVHSLQKLAEHHGGSLGTNPSTGLPEAGFLSSLLPTLIGAGLTFMSGGALTPLMAAGITGAGYGLASGSLSKGLTAGLGAYGGAGLTGGVMGAGESALNSQAALGASADVGTTSAGDALTADTNALNTGATSTATPATPYTDTQKLTAGLKNVTGEGGLSALKGALPKDSLGFGKLAFMAGAPVIADAMNPQTTATPYKSDSTMPQRLRYVGNNQYQQISDAEAKQLRGYADGGVPTAQPKADVPAYGDQGHNFGSEQLYAQYLPSTTQGVAALPTSTPQAPTAPAVQPRADVPAYGDMGHNFGKEQLYGAYVPPTNTAAASTVAGKDTTAATTPQTPAFTYEGMANGGSTGGISDLGGYSDGGRLLRGPGDGVSDSIPAVIGKKQPARLADGEFVVPARIVSELGNGSTEAGARKLYAMLDRIQAGRSKSIGKGKVATNSKMENHLPA